VLHIFSGPSSTVSGQRPRDEAAGSTDDLDVGIGGSSGFSGGSVIDDRSSRQTMMTSDDNAARAPRVKPPRNSKQHYRVISSAGDLHARLQ